jgi:16S rRNA (uracil1498-N3)-methyltransferase
MQRYFAKDKKENKIILSDSDLHHIKTVMRMNIGDNIECIYNKKLYLCRIEDFNNNILIEKEIDENNELDTEIIIAIALVKEQKFDLILQKLTELGVSKIIPLNMERSIVKLDKERFKKKKSRWEAICKEASEQSHRNIIPEITDIMTLKDLVKLDVDKKFVCSVKEKENKVGNYLQNKTKCATMLFVIGPEGGITDNEEQFLNEFGYTSISLGPRVMRVETAAIYIASIANFYCLG